MKRLHSGLLVFDTLDIVCLSFSVGSGIACAVKFCRNRKYRRKRISGEDPIVTELKEKSRILMFSEKGNRLKVPLMRGGDQILAGGFSLMIRSKKLTNIIRAIVMAKQNQRKLRFLQQFFVLFNFLLTHGVGLRFALGGSLDYTQILLIAFPSTLSGILMGLTTSYPFSTTSNRRWSWH